MGDDRLERALDDCLRALRRGVSLDQCLAPYAELRLQLQPLLATATGVWAEPVAGLPERRHTAVRSELMSAIAAEPQRGRRTLGALPLPTFGRRSGVRPLAFASVALAVVVGVLMIASSIMMRGPSSSEAATVLTILQGDVRVEAADGTTRAGANGMRIQTGDSIITSPGARAVLTFFDGSTVTLDSDTVVVLHSLREKDGRLDAHLVQARGSTWTHVPTELDTARIEIDTPTARVQTTDASFSTTVQQGGGTQVGSQSGDLEVASGDQRAAVQGGQQTAVDSPGIVVPASTSDLPDKELVLRIRGPVYAFLTDPSGATIGTLDPGVPVNQVAGATATREGDTLVVRIPNPDDGQYALGLRSAGDGQVTVVAEVRNGTVETASNSFAVTSSETLTSGLQLSGDELALSDVSRTTEDIKPVPVTVPDEAVKKATNSTTQLVAPTSMPVPPTATATPTLTPTATPVPPTPTDTPTRVPPTSTPEPPKPTATPTQRPPIKATPVKDDKPIDTIDVADATADSISAGANIVGPSTAR